VRLTTNSGLGCAPRCGVLESKHHGLHGMCEERMPSALALEIPSRDRHPCRITRDPSEHPLGSAEPRFFRHWPSACQLEKGLRFSRIAPVAGGELRACGVNSGRVSGSLIEHRAKNRRATLRVWDGDV
jgi:hypothetical protein